MSQPAKSAPQPSRFGGLGALLVAACLAGCAGTPTAQSPTSCSIDEPSLMGHIDGRELARQLADDLCPKIRAIDPYASTSGDDHGLLVVADPVEVQTYMPTHLGRAFGDVLRAAILQRCGVPIRQVELSRDFSLTQQGITALTRNLRDVRGPQFQARDAIITTYTMTKNRVVFVARRIDLAPGAIMAMSTREVSWACEQNLMGATSVRTSVY